MSTIPEVKMYRIIQKNNNTVLFKICLESSCKDKNNRELVENKIKKSFLDKIPDAEIKFEYFDNPIDLMKGANKYRIVVNEILYSKNR